MKITACPLCSKTNNPVIMLTRDYRFGTKGWYRFAKCNRCAVVYLLNPLSKQELNKLYEENYQPAVLSLTTKYNFTFTSARKLWWKINGTDVTNIDKGSNKVLDIGFGQGTALLFLKSKGYDVYGVEINSNLVKAAQRADIKAYDGPLEEINFPSNFFDLILCSQVLEHLSEPKKILKEMFRILKPGGKVNIYVPNSRGYLSYLFKQYWHGWYAPFHYFIFNEEGLRFLAENSGFNVLQVKTVTPTNFFIVSLKAFIWRNFQGKLATKGHFLEQPFLKLTVALFLRVVDFLLPKRGDCLQITLVKNEKANV